MRTDTLELHIPTVDRSRRSVRADHLQFAPHPETVTIGDDEYAVHVVHDDSDGSIIFFTLTDLLTGDFYFETPYETTELREEAIIGAFLDEGEHAWEVRSRSYTRIPAPDDTDPEDDDI